MPSSRRVTARVARVGVGARASARPMQPQHESPADADARCAAWSWRLFACCPGPLRPAATGGPGGGDDNDPLLHRVMDNAAPGLELLADTIDGDYDSDSAPCGP